MIDKIYRVGLVGAGRFGKNYIKTINGMSDKMQIVALATSKPENAKLIKNKVEVYSDYAEMVMSSGLDFLIIATPPHTHAQIIEHCLATLKPFIVEKPFCTSLAETKSLVTQLQRDRLACIVDYTQMFNPAFRGLKGAIFKQKIKQISSKVHAFGPFRNDVSMLWDWLPHDLSMIYDVAKELPSSVTATHEVDPNYDNAGQLNIELDFKKFVAKIEIDNVAGKKFRVFQADTSFSHYTMMDNELFEVRDDVRPITVSSETPLQTLLETFLLYLESGDSFGLEMSIDIANTIEKVITSIETGKKTSFV